MSVGNWRFPATLPFMKRNVVIVWMLVLPSVLLVSLLAGGGCDRASSRADAHGTNIVILSEKNFQDEVIAAKVPVLVDFWAPWCGPCRSIAPLVNELADDFAGRARVAKVNVDEASALAQKYGIQAIPTFLYFRDGRVVDQVMGGAPKRELAAKLDKLIAESAKSAPAGR